LGTYTYADWKALSAEHRNKVAKGRKRSAEQQQQQAVINVSQVVTTPGQDLDAQSAITSVTAGTTANHKLHHLFVQ